jgi:hypothetical protein
MAEAIGRAKVILEVDAATYSAALDKANSKLKAFGQAAQDAGHSTVSSMQASSGALRLVQGNIENNTRAVERFLTTIPGVGKALTAIFPLVGAAAFAGMLVKVGTEAAAAIKKIEGMAGVVRQAFDQMNASALKSVDSMNLSTDKIREATALLQNKAFDTMTLGLDEARVKADDLAISLTKDYTALKKLLDENQNGMFAQIVLRKGATADVSGEIQDKFARISTLGDQKRDALQPTNEDGSLRTVTDADKARAADLDKQMRAVQKEVVQLANQQIAMRTGRQMYGPDGKIIYGPNLGAGSASYAGANGDQSVNLELLRAARGTAMSQEREADSGDANSAAEVDQKEAEAQKKAAEEAKKTQAKLLKQMEEGIAEQKAMWGVSTADELAYWSARISAFTEGTDQYHTVLMETFKLQADLYKEMQEGKKKYLEDSGKSTVEGNDLLGEGQQKLITEPAIAQDKRTTEANEKYATAQAKAAEITLKNNAALAESAITIGVTQGRIDQMTAATMRVSAQGEEYAATLKKINDELAAQKALIAKDDSLIGPDDKDNANREQEINAANERAQAGGQYALQQQQDAAAISGQKVGPALSTAVNQMVNAWTDASQQIVSLFENSLSTLNSTLVNVMTSRNRAHSIGRQFEAAGHGIFTDATNASLHGAEGMLGQALGFGAGAKVAHVHVDNWPGDIAGAASSMSGIAGKAAGWLGGFFGSGKSGAPTSTIPDGGGYDFGMNPLASLAMDALPFLAGGGYMPANSMAIVGEEGPEPFFTKSAGTILPNSSLGGTTHNISIDARGSQDPAATEMAIHRAMGQYFPASVGASVSAVQERNRRVPLSNR